MSKKLGFGSGEFFVFSLNKSSSHVKFACLTDGGGLVVGNGANNGLVPMLADPQCEILPAFMPDVFSLGIQEKCAPIGDCKNAFGNCHANLQDCLAAPWQPVDGWQDDFPNAGGDPLKPIDYSLPDEEGSSSCSGRATGCTTGSRWVGDYYVDEGGQAVDNRVLVRYAEGPGCPDLEIPDCSGGYTIRNWNETAFDGDMFENVDECGSKTGFSSGFGACPSFKCDEVILSSEQMGLDQNAGIVQADCVVDERRDECKYDCAPVFELNTYPPLTEGGSPRTCIGIFCRVDKESSSGSSGGGDDGGGGVALAAAPAAAAAAHHSAR